MGTTIDKLARWASDLTIDDIPGRVRERALLQHLSVAGAIRSVRERPIAQALAKSGASRGKAVRATGGTTAPRDAIRLHAGLSAYLDFDDYLFMGHTGHGAVGGAWAGAKGATLDDMVCATVAANEIAGRVGASLLIGPTNGQGWAAVHASASAVAYGRVMGLDSAVLADALAIALATPHHIPLRTVIGGGQAKLQVAAAPAVQGVDAVTQATAGVSGPRDVLDARNGLLDTLAWVPLRNAFSGLGAAWLTETLAYKLNPGCAYIHAPVQAVLEILDRHVKAADKRLRPDQVERIEVRTGAPAWMLSRLASEHPVLDPAAIAFCARRAIGVAVVGHAFGPEELSEAWLTEHAENVRKVAQRVEIVHDWNRTLGLVEHFVDVAAPLFAGLTLAELRRAAQAARLTYNGGLPRPGPADVLSIARARPDRWMDRIRHTSGDLADCHFDEWQYRFGADVEVYSIRGGCWPETRTLPAGSPGWSWGDTRTRLLRKFAWSEDGGEQRADGLLAASGASDAAGFVGQLFA